jgi:hypothetical protein
LLLSNQRVSSSFRLPVKKKGLPKAEQTRATPVFSLPSGLQIVTFP